MEQELGCGGELEVGRGRRWSIEDKRAVVELSLDPECSMIYKIDDTLRGIPAEERLAGRRELMPAIMAELRAYLVSNRRRFSAKGKMAGGINYVLNHWDGLTRFLDDGRIELDTNTVERTIRPIALSRKNSLFAGSHEGARTWAVIGSFMETCRMNDVDPLAWLTATLEKLAAGHSIKDLDALMPWNFTKLKRA